MKIRSRGKDLYNRLLTLNNIKKSFFLWGARQTGKSTLLQRAFPHTMVIDLLKSDEYARFSREPSLLRQQLLARERGQFVIIDEIQRVPELLDEVHWLIENHACTFSLSGSSARRILRVHANLLGGRALRFQLHGLSAHEIGSGPQRRRDRQLFQFFAGCGSFSEHDQGILFHR